MLDSYSVGLTGLLLLAGFVPEINTVPLRAVIWYVNGHSGDRRNYIFIPRCDYTRLVMPKNLLLCLNSIPDANTVK